MLYTAILYKYKTEVSSCRLLIVEFFWLYEKSPSTLVQYFEWMRVIPVCQVLAVYRQPNKKKIKMYHSETQGMANFKDEKLPSGSVLTFSYLKPSSLSH